MPRQSAAARNPNRSDLTRAPVSTVPNQPYGEAAEQQAAQRSVPMGAQPVAPPSGPPQASPGQPDLATLLQQHAAAGGGPHPQGFLRPTERPNEPVTHGLPAGPGGGPEVLTGVGAAARDSTVESGTLQNLLTNMASSPGATSAIRDLAARAQAGAM